MVNRQQAMVLKTMNPEARNDHDHLSGLPPECKFRIVNYLHGQDAASLRLRSRIWADTAIEGLSTVATDIGRCPASFGGIFSGPEDSANFYCNLKCRATIPRHLFA